MSDKAKKVKPIELGDDQHNHLAGGMVKHEEKMKEKPLIKKDTTQKSLQCLLIQVQRNQEQ